MFGCSLSPYYCACSNDSEPLHPVFVVIDVSLLAMEGALLAEVGGACFSC